MKFMHYEIEDPKSYVIEERGLILESQSRQGAGMTPKFHLSGEFVLGVLTPIEWDAKGKPVEFSVFTPEEEDILIKEFPRKKKLRKLVNHPVFIQGKIGKNSYGERFIKAVKIKKLRSKPEISQKEAPQEFSLCLPQAIFEGAA